MIEKTWQILPWIFLSLIKPLWKVKFFPLPPSEPHNQSAPFSGLQKLEDIESDIVSDKKTISFCSGATGSPDLKWAF